MTDNSPVPGPLTTSHLSGSTGVFVPLAVIRLTGDPASAIMLGQILWWLTEARHPVAVERAGDRWLVKPHGSWEAECGLSVDQARGAVKKLVERGLIEQRRWKHDGAPTTHLRACWDAIESALTTQIHSADTPIPFGESDRSLDSVDTPEPPPLETEETSTETTLAVPDGTDVVADLCRHLADRIEDNGSRRPAVTDRWLTACRLLIERDGRTPEQVRRAIDWCQDDEFWRANVMSMPTLRRQYDTLRLRAKANGNGHKSRGAREADEYRALRERMAAADEADTRALGVAS